MPGQARVAVRCGHHAGEERRRQAGAAYLPVGAVIVDVGAGVWVACGRDIGQLPPTGTVAEASTAGRYALPGGAREDRRAASAAAAPYGLGAIGGGADGREVGATDGDHVGAVGRVAGQVGAARVGAGVARGEIEGGTHGHGMHEALLCLVGEGILLRVVSSGGRFATAPAIADRVYGWIAGCGGDRVLQADLIAAAAAAVADLVAQVVFELGVGGHAMGVFHVHRRLVPGIVLGAATVFVDPLDRVGIGVGSGIGGDLAIPGGGGELCEVAVREGCSPEGEADSLAGAVERGAAGGMSCRVVGGAEVGWDVAAPAHGARPAEHLVEADDIVQAVDGPHAEVRRDRRVAVIGIECPPVSQAVIVDADAKRSRNSGDRATEGERRAIGAGIRSKEPVIVPPLLYRLHLRRSGAEIGLELFLSQVDAVTCLIGDEALEVRQIA